MSRGARAQRDWAARTGFTLIELLFVLLIAGILGTLAFPRFSEYQKKRQLMNAQNAFTLAAARARASAVERGDVVLLWVQPESDRITVLSGDGVDTMLVVDLKGGEIRADVLLSSAMTFCYLPRGFAHPSCGNGASLPRRIGFGNTADTVWSTISAVGQVQPE